MIITIALTFAITMLANAGLDKYYYESQKDTWTAQAKDAGYQVAVVLVSHMIAVYLVNVI